jgi:beta-glucosidase
MCSYQRSNHSYACQNSKLLNGILKTELGFEGFVVTDWNAQHSGVASVDAGLDMVMPSGGFWGSNLTEAVTNGSISTTRINDMATRIMAAYYFVGQDKNFPDVGIYPYSEKHPFVDVQADHAKIIREVGAAGHVLVKNKNNALPLKHPKYLSVFGYDAEINPVWGPPNLYGRSYPENFGWETFNGTLVAAGGSGSGSPAYVISPFKAIQDRVIADKGILRWDFFHEDPLVEVSSEVCVVFINAYASEFFDRTSLRDESSDRLVKNVASKCENTVVVVHSAGVRVVDEWIDHENVTAVIFGGLPGQESGNALADVLYGDVSPSGRLPYTVAKQEKDYGHLLNPTQGFGKFPEDNFSEGVYIDYRAFDRDGIEPRFEFGFGLTYTEFRYSDITVEKVTKQVVSSFPAEAQIIQGAFFLKPGYPPLTFSFRWEPEHLGDHL